jgi:hypothetical protein
MLRRPRIPDRVRSATPRFWAKREDSDSFRHLRRVKYEDRTPAYFLNLPDDIALYTKSVEWSYEKEWRIIRNFNEATLIKGKDSYDTDVLLFAVPPSCIKAVVIGYKATKDSVDQLKSIVGQSSELSHFSFRRAVLQDDGAIEIVPRALPDGDLSGLVETLVVVVFVADLGQYLVLFCVAVIRIAD